MLCKYLRSSLKTVRRTVFPPGGVALSSNPSLTASQVKQKEQAEACSSCLAGVERFELPDDGVRVRSLTAWRHPIKVSMAGVAGFEPANAKVKVSCLTAWRYPKKMSGVSKEIRTLDLQGHNLAL